MVLTSHYLTLIVQKQCCCEIVSDCWGGSRGYIQNEHCSCLSSKSVHWKTLLHMCTVHSASPPRGYIQSVVPSPLIRRPQSHRVQLLWLKNTPIPIFTRLSLEKTSRNPSSHNKPYTLKTCILEMGNVGMNKLFTKGIWLQHWLMKHLKKSSLTKKLNLPWHVYLLLDMT